MFNLSVVLPVCNEEGILERNVIALERHLAGIPLLDAFEIVLVCNGCRDGSERLSRALEARYPNRIRALSLEARGLGRAIRAGIDAASHEYIMFYAVDLPFGLNGRSRSRLPPLAPTRIESSSGPRAMPIHTFRGHWHVGCFPPRSRSSTT